MDGNGRWAEKKDLPRVEGHRAGRAAVRKIIEACLKKKIKILSLFAFSSENWARPIEEVDFLMQLFSHALETEIQELHQHGISIKFIGDRQRLAPDLQQQMRVAEDLTKNNENLLLNLAVNYSGKWDIVQSTRTICKKMLQNELKEEAIDEALISQHLSTAGLPEPDLLIRTSGELRISNFFLWQLAYTELYFSAVHWPDFDNVEFDKALTNFSARQRRYGLTSAQVDT